MADRTIDQVEEDLAIEESVEFIFYPGEGHADPPLDPPTEYPYHKDSIWFKTYE